MKKGNTSFFFIAAIAVFFLLKPKTVSGIYGMTKSKFLPPYDNDGHTTFRNADKKSGVYLIKENGKMVYIGYSATNLYRTLYRHFQKWKHPYQEVTTYARDGAKEYTVRVIFTTAQQADRLETYLIQKYLPRDNEGKIKAGAENTGKTEYKKMVEAEPMPF